jgi:hypothetical protein
LKDLASQFAIKEGDLEFDQLSTTSSISFIASTINGEARSVGMTSVTDKASEKSGESLLQLLEKNSIALKNKQKHQNQCST